MQLKQLELEGGGTLTVYLRDSCERMPKAIDRPLVLVVPGGGYTHVSAREGDPVALQFAAAGYHAAVLDYAICEQAADYLPLRQLFRERLVSVIERQIGAVFPGHLQTFGNAIHDDHLLNAIYPL